MRSPNYILLQADGRTLAHWRWERYSGPVLRVTDLMVVFGADGRPLEIRQHATHDKAFLCM